MIQLGDTIACNIHSILVYEVNPNASQSQKGIRQYLEWFLRFLETDSQESLLNEQILGTFCISYRSNICAMRY